MRDRWRRTSALITLDLGELTELLRPVFAQGRAVRSKHLEYGLVNTNIKVEVSDRATPVILRIYQRSSAVAAKEAALLRALCDRLPVPRLHYSSADNPVTGHPYAILDWVDGERLDVLVGAGADIGAIGGAIGDVLARIHGVTFERYGFLGPDLKVSHPIDLDRAGLVAYAQRALAEAPGSARLGEAVVAKLARFARERGDVLAHWPGPCLVHGDFNGSNVLLRRAIPEPSATGCDSGPPLWEVAAVLDWEFALSATPPFDFAQLLRPPLAAQPALAEEAARRYRDAGGTIPENWQEIARVTDLFAWIDIVSRPDVDPAVIDDARAAIGLTLADDRN